MCVTVCVRVVSACVVQQAGAKTEPEKVVSGWSATILLSPLTAPLSLAAAAAAAAAHRWPREVLNRQARGGHGRQQRRGGDAI